MDHPDQLGSRDWDNMRRHVLLHTMPPDDEPAPSESSRLEFESGLRAWLADRSVREKTPAPLRRLSRGEISRSLETLLGSDYAAVSTSLPEDETAHGFDNNRDMQPLPPARMERILAAVSKAVDTALLPGPVRPRIQQVLPRGFTGDGGLFPDSKDYHASETGGAVRIGFHTPSAGLYRWSLTVHAHGAGAEPTLLQLEDSAPQPVWQHSRSTPEIISTVLELPAGDNTLVYRLTNPLNDPDAPDPHRRTRRILVREATLDGPLDGDTAPSAGFREKFGPVPPVSSGMEEQLRAAERVLTKFARGAWRRPLTDNESLRLVSLTGQSLAAGLRYDEAVAGTVKAVLASPTFLFLADPVDSPPHARTYALAARLSYFLWSRPPDQALLAGGRGGWTEQALTSTATRMLDDPRAAAFAEDFAGQWLQLRNTLLADPDKTLFPSADADLRFQMVEESSRFFLSLLRENAPVLELLTADHTFLNAGLARFYGRPPVSSRNEFTEVSLRSTRRRGLLGQASVLLLTSYPNRTSPVLRGKYILENLLGLEPPPPPPNVPTLIPAHPHSGSRDPVRAALERHREDPGCASCHRAMDPLGFPLESWDAIGREIPSEGNDPHPATVFTGQSLTSVADVTQWLVEVQGERIVRHAAEKLMTYALGRGLSAGEKLDVIQITDAAGGRLARFRDLVVAVVRSPAFRGEAAPP